MKRRAFLANADAVMGHFLVPDGYHAVRLAKELGIPSCGMAWGDDVHAWPAANATWRSKLETVLSECDQLVACSHHLAADGALWTNRQTAWEVVYAGIDLDTFHPPSENERAVARKHSALRVVPAGAPILLMIGQPVKAKGYLEMLEVWETLTTVADRWHLVMVGANWGDVDVKREITNRGLTRAHWIGPQAAADIPALLHASDGFVLPSHNEGLSLSVMEAMATGLPVITTDVGGHREVLRDGENGWLIPRQNVSALLEACTDLMTNPGEAKARGIRAHTTIGNIGTPKDSAAKLAGILRRMIHRGRSSASATSGLSSAS